MNHENMIVHRNRQMFSALVASLVFACLLAVPELALAQPAEGSDAPSRVQDFFDNIGNLLNIASIAIVTIAIIFSGYQIAFNHKRIGDVAPVLIGGFLIGAAAQIASMLLPDPNVAGTPGGMAMIASQLLQYA